MPLKRRARVTTRQPKETSQEDCSAQLHRFIADNLHLGPSLKDLAGFLGYSEKYCSEVFQARMGQPFSRYLKRLRLEKAERLLHESSATLAQIAEALGFHDPFAFSHFFKKATGYSPKLFRERRGRLPLLEQAGNGPPAAFFRPMNMPDQEYEHSAWVSLAVEWH